MHRNRVFTIIRSDVAYLCAQPVFWILLVVLGLLTFSLSPAVFIPSEPAVDGEQVWINSRYALLQFFAFSGLLGYTVLGSFLAGISLIRDADSGIAPIMNSTPLTATEYALAKMLGVVAVLGLALMWHIGVTMVSYELVIGIQNESIKGPFNLWYYLSMGTLGALPGISIGAGLTFVATALTRRSLVVYAVPALVLVATLSFALVTPTNGSWSPVAMLLDPSGIRWLFHTVFAEDLGVVHYNTAPIARDSLYITNRLVMFGAGVLCFAVAIPAIHRWMRRPDKQVLPKLRLKSRKPATQEANHRIPFTIPPMAKVSIPQWQEVLIIASMEWREAVRQPIYYLIVLVLLGLVGETVSESGASILGTSMYLTAGSIAVVALPMLSGLLCILALMYVAEASHRDRRAKLAPVVHATPIRSASFVAGKLLAGMGLVIAVLVGVTIQFLLQLQAQGSGFVALKPFLYVWGGGLMPTLLVWIACTMFIAETTKNWATTYAISLILFGFSIYATARGWVDWSTNWLLWGALRWSDMGAFVQDHEALLLNRSWVLLLACLIICVTAIHYQRTRPDRKRSVFTSWRQRHILTRVSVLGLAVLVIALIGYTRWQVYTGFQGEAAKQQAKAHWQMNMSTWRDFQAPDMTFMDIEVTLDPDRHHMAVIGSYTLVNGTQYPINVLPFTMPDAFEQIEWQMHGEPVESENRAGLHLLSLEDPLAIYDTVRVGFRYEAYIPKGMSRNGGARTHFILPSGVLLSNFRGDFLPVIGYKEHRGISEENRYDPVDHDPRFTHLQDRLSNRSNPFMSRIKVTVPERYTVTATGTQSDYTQGGELHTATWETQYPVQAINVMAGEWSEKKSGTNAVYYHPAHDYNTDTLLEALVAARLRYSEWFYPYPWGSLRINEFPNAGTGATAYPTNISFSEGMGFLTRPESGAYLPYIVAAHEVAHQWWGHLVSPAEAPGADLLTEAMANYATIRLLEAEKGPEARDTFLQWLEDQYLTNRRIDRELPLSESTLNTPDAEAVVYNKGALVLWMMHQQLGEDRMDAALHEFIEAFIGKRPGLDDFLAVVRKYAEDPIEFDRFVEEWIESVGEGEFGFEWHR